MRKIVVAIIITLVLSGCSALFEENIKNATVTCVFPIGGDSISTYNVTFWWEPVKYAKSYEIQVVQGTFTNIQVFLLDSTVTNTNYIFTLTPGAYQWRVRALNNSSQSGFTTHSFTILKNDSLSGQTVILQSPSDGLYSNNTTQTFRWYPLSQSSYYTFELLTLSGSILYSTNLNQDSITLSNLQQGDLQWRVRANNNTSATAFYSRTLTIDTIQPNTPTLSLPLYGDSVSSPVSLSWDRGATGGSPIFDSVLIYSDSLITLYQASVVAGTSTSLNSITSGKYFWRVRSKDQAGNLSSYSQTGKYIVR